MSITKTREVFSLPNVHYASDVDIEWEEWKGEDKKSLTPAPSPEGEGSKENPGPQAG